MAHALMENRHGRVVDGCPTKATGHAERMAALHMIEPRAERGTRVTRGTDARSWRASGSRSLSVISGGDEVVGALGWGAFDNYLRHSLCRLLHW